MFEAYDQDTKKLKAEKWRAQQRAEREARKPYWEKPPWLVRKPLTALPPMTLPQLDALEPHLRCLHGLV